MRRGGPPAPSTPPTRDPAVDPSTMVGPHLALDVLRHTTTPSLLSPICICRLTVGWGPPTAMGSELSFCPTTRFPIQLVVAGGAPDLVEDGCARTPAI